MSARRSRSGGTTNGKDVQPVVEIAPEASRLDHRLEVAVRRRDQAHVDAQRARAAEALELLLLEHAQELRLELDRDVAHFVQEERSAVGQLEAPDALRDRARERAALVAEELALEQARRDGGAVDLDEAALAPRAALVDRARDQLLAGARLAADQHRRAGGRHRLHQLQHLPERGRLADDVVEVVRGADLLLEVDVLRRELVPQLDDLLKCQRVLDGDGDLVGHGLQQFLVLVAERLAGEPAHVERSQPALPDGQGRAAHRPDALVEQSLHELVRQLLEIRPVEAHGLPGREGDAGGSRVRRQLEPFRHEPLAFELERAQVEDVPLGIPGHETRVLVRERLPQSADEGAEEWAWVEVGDQRVVDLEQQSEAIALVRELLLRGLGGFVMQRVVDRQRDLARQLLEERHRSRIEVVLRLAREDQRAEPPERGGEGDRAVGAHAFPAQDLGHDGKARLVIELRDYERLLRLPGDARGRLVDRHLVDDRGGGMEGRDAVQPHHVAGRVVQHEAQAVEGRALAKRRDEVEQQRGKVALRGRRARNVEERSVALGFVVHGGNLSRRARRP